MGAATERDDAVIGVRSTSRTFGRHSRTIIAALYGLAVILIGWSVALSGGGWPSLFGLAAFAAHLGWHVVRLDPARPDVCLALFRSNRDAGALLFCGLVADALLRA